MQEHFTQPKGKWAESPVLIALASALAVLTLFSPNICKPTNLFTELACGYTPLLLGCLSLWLCMKARRKAKHKKLVVLYTVILLPFAFGYPVWLLFIWIMYRYGNYHGPMP